MKLNILLLEKNSETNGRNSRKIKLIPNSQLCCMKLKWELALDNLNGYFALKLEYEEIGRNFIIVCTSSFCRR